MRKLMWRETCEEYFHMTQTGKKEACENIFQCLTTRAQTYKIVQLYLQMFVLILSQLI